MFLIEHHFVLVLVGKLIDLAMISVSFFSIGMISSASRLFQVDVIVLDEVHYLSDISRGTVWEEIVSNARFCLLVLVTL